MRMLHVQHLIVIKLAVEICTLDVDLVHLHPKVVGHGNNGLCAGIGDTLSRL